jgi:hypothetical protein
LAGGGPVAALVQSQGLARPVGGRRVRYRRAHAASFAIVAECDYVVGGVRQRDILIIESVINATR